MRWPAAETDQSKCGSQPGGASWKPAKSNPGATTHDTSVQAPVDAADCQAPAGTTTTCSATGVPSGVCTLSTLGYFELAVSGTGPYRVEFSGVPAASLLGSSGSASSLRPMAT